MATITSAQDGFWSAGATWVGGSKPAVGDDVIVAHAVTVDSSEAADALEVTLDGNLAVASDLDIGGDVTIDGQWSVEGTLYCGGSFETSSIPADNSGLIVFDDTAGTPTLTCGIPMPEIEVNNAGVTSFVAQNDVWCGDANEYDFTLTAGKFSIGARDLYCAHFTQTNGERGGSGNYHVSGNVQIDAGSGAGGNWIITSAATAELDADTDATAYIRVASGRLTDQVGSYMTRLQIDAGATFDINAQTTLLYRPSDNNCFVNNGTLTGDGILRIFLPDNSITLGDVHVGDSDLEIYGMNGSTVTVNGAVRAARVKSYAFAGHRGVHLLLGGGSISGDLELGDAGADRPTTLTLGGTWSIGGDIAPQNVTNNDNRLVLNGAHVQFAGELDGTLLESVSGGGGALAAGTVRDLAGVSCPVRAVGSIDGGGNDPQVAFRERWRRAA
jgi:hypothetical protein